MELSLDFLIAVSQIIPLFLLASFLDGDALNSLRKHARRAQYYWLSLVAFVLAGELFALMAIANGGADGWRAWLIWIATVLAMVNLMNVAVWRVLGVSLLAMTGLDSKKRPKNTSKK